MWTGDEPSEVLGREASKGWIARGGRSRICQAALHGQVTFCVRKGNVFRGLGVTLRVK